MVLANNMGRTPLNWDSFFDRKRTITVEGDNFNVYTIGNSGPLFILVHGGGYTGLTWACFVEELRAKVECRVLAPDMRGHGETSTQDDEDLSIERQVNDVHNIYEKYIADEQLEISPSVILVGHSMGGAVVAHVAHQNKISNLVAVAVIDVVEGSAMAALGHMSAFLRSRPNEFPSEEKAVEWCLSSGMTRNLRAARVSMPSQIVASSNGSINNTIMLYRWRTQLSKSQPHWNGWFKGLSNIFLECKAAKILILANVDRLDTTLLTGQMRGLFQTEVLARVGHAVHEDSPADVANIFVKLMNRYRVLINKTTKRSPSGLSGSVT